VGSYQDKEDCIQPSKVVGGSVRAAFLRSREVDWSSKHSKNPLLDWIAMSIDAFKFDASFLSLVASHSMSHNVKLLWLQA
jgi:hypothetical protein